ncbi:MULTISPECIES: restriction endonuclease subunit M [unclassified Moraxella]|uniref:restriction endonuclease subunit M n=1 Tax=unclassified Moraxella TaxID=2685852 RepID=UPI002B40BC27|nr:MULTISPECIES: restriction endonuclease subunit M [unclassified Moraxella]
MTDTAQTTKKPKQTKSKERVADFGEVFTAEKEVNAMLNLLPQTIWNKITNTFLEPACGTGNFLAEILSRKLAIVLKSAQINKSQKSPKYSKFHYERNAIYAISSIYGIELLLDNCNECRKRLLDIFSTHYQTYFKDIDDEVIRVAEFLLTKNIINGDALTLKDLNDEPIIFSEWEFINDIQINRRDYIYRDLIDKASDRELPLFSDLGEEAYIPTPIKEYFPIHFLTLYEQG